MALTMVALFVGCSNVDHLTISLCGEVTASLNHGQVQVFSLPKTKSKSFIHYIPSSCEIYIMEHATELGYDSALNPTGCNIGTLLMIQVKLFAIITNHTQITLQLQYCGSRI